MAEETIDEMLTRVGKVWDAKSKALYRRSDALANAHDVKGAEKARSRAAEWGDFANYAYGKGVFPIKSNDAELSLTFGAERAKAMAANQYINLNERQ